MAKKPTEIEGPRSVANNREYRNAYYRARGKAVARLMRAHRKEFWKYLREEREKEGLPYRAEPGGR